MSPVLSATNCSNAAASPRFNLSRNRSSGFSRNRSSAVERTPTKAAEATSFNSRRVRLAPQALNRSTALVCADVPLDPLCRCFVPYSTLAISLHYAGHFDDADWAKVATGACLTSTRPAVKFAVSAIIHIFERASPCELARGNCLAKYKKKRARELKHDKFRDTTMLLVDRVATRTAGRGRQVLYVLLAVVVLAAAAYGIYRWRQKRADEAEAAMGRAIAIARAEINPAPPSDSKDPVSVLSRNALNGPSKNFRKSSPSMAIRIAARRNC